MKLNLTAVILACMFHGYGMLNYDGKEPIFGHSGQRSGVLTNFRFLPESGYTVVILSNQHGDSADQLYYLIMEMLARK